MKNKKEIKFPVKKKKSLREVDMEIEEFIDQVDANMEQMDRDFKEFKRRYGEDKSFDDWMAYEEKEKRIKERKLYSKIEHLSFNFKKELSKK
ncbi:hypothetical protein CNO13_08055 (plasmid) [Borrelia miyamotoi]|uniref:Uncharacterized protein n=2 Tax=Borrelia miyamotoi TaxID=47466 RepID=A0AAQ3CN54_9SPIR|nr:hypothetical protein [Borrelia miyamotoi]MBW6186004.1 hypothetical protein [Pseudomonas aeruginosa]ATQ17945.1 hypothetical protein CNO12_06615 [Borrelia miyamotoi]ATQ19211.1 hypothetical protein CNO11_06720 [Borrelia miyamotoi]ATQ20479.1 hypothetical protein CNO10_06845 [Borrelia miyamotoi]ATQ21679.1 hypothetical protein CNO09_06470 [Borrelia miyamotoi]